MLAILSLGSCMGDKAAVIEAAIAALAALPSSRLTARASLYETEPVDVDPRFGDLIFLNTVVALETALPADDLSTAVHEIEFRLGRRRSGIRHEPRTIDIDIVALGDLTCDRPDLRLPHPEAANRRFVMEPLAEILPDFVLPGQSLTAAALLATLPERPAVRRLA